MYGVDKEKVGAKNIPDFPLRLIRKFYPKKDTKQKMLDSVLKAAASKSLSERLQIVAEELKLLEILKIYAGYQLYKVNQNPTQLTEIELGYITQAKIEYTKILKDNELENRKKINECVNEHFKNVNQSINNISEQEIDLCTDGALSALNALAKIEKKSDLEFYASFLMVVFQQSAKTIQEYIILFTLPDQFKGADVKEISKALRQHTALGHLEIVKACLEHGADPLEEGIESKKNAIDRAKEKGFTEIETELVNFCKHKSKNETVDINALTALSFTNTQAPTPSSTSQKEEIDPPVFKAH